MSSVLGLSEGVLATFIDVKDAREFLVNNEIFWDQKSEIEYIQTHPVDLGHLLFVYRKYLGTLLRCIELVESNLTLEHSSTEETEQCQFGDLLRR